MGVKQSKCDGIYLPETPTGLKNFRYFTQTPKPPAMSTEVVEMSNLLDPRSPGLNRTPLTLQQEETFASKLKQSMPGILRKRLLKASNYNLNDPRSPTADRTPIVFEDGAERALSLDDTFADLLVETRASTNESAEQASIVEDVDKSIKGETVFIESKAENKAENHSLSFISMASEEGSMQEHTPIVCMSQQPLDPRSPTLGLERTPIVLTDDLNEEQLDEEMEDMLAKLSLHLSNAGEDSLLSFGALSEKEDVVNKPTNKHLERVRVPKKPARASKSPVAQIYEDNENVAPKTNNNKENNDIMEVPKRTPLSCVGNQEPRLRNLNKLQDKKKNKHALTALTLKTNNSKDTNNMQFLEA